MLEPNQTSAPVAVGPLKTCLKAHGNHHCGIMTCSYRVGKPFVLDTRSAWSCFQLSSETRLGGFSCGFSSWAASSTRPPYPSHPGLAVKYGASGASSQSSSTPSRLDSASFRLDRHLIMAGRMTAGSVMRSGGLG